MLLRRLHGQQFGLYRLYHFDWRGFLKSGAVLHQFRVSSSSSDRTLYCIGSEPTRIGETVSGGSRRDSDIPARGEPRHDRLAAASKPTRMPPAAGSVRRIGDARRPPSMKGTLLFFLETASCTRHPPARTMEAWLEWESPGILFRGSLPQAIENGVRNEIRDPCWVGSLADCSRPAL